MAEEKKLAEISPEETKLEETKLEETKPEEVKLGEAQPGEAKPGEAKPGEAKPERKPACPPKKVLKQSVPNNIKRNYITYIEENKTTAYQAWKKFKTQYPNVSEPQVRQWLKRKEGILKKPAGKRAQGGGRKPTCEALEKLLFDYISQKRKREEPVKATYIKQKALEIAAIVEVQGFRASNGWLRNFLKRYNLSLK